MASKSPRRSPYQNFLDLLRNLPNQTNAKHAKAYFDYLQSTGTRYGKPYSRGSMVRFITAMQHIIVGLKDANVAEATDEQVKAIWDDLALTLSPSSVMAYAVSGEIFRDFAKNGPPDDKGASNGNGKNLFQKHRRILGALPTASNTKHAIGYLDALIAYRDPETKQPYSKSTIQTRIAPVCTFLAVLGDVSVEDMDQDDWDINWERLAVRSQAAESTMYRQQLHVRNFLIHVLSAEHAKKVASSRAPGGKSETSSHNLHDYDVIGRIFHGITAIEERAYFGTVIGALAPRREASNILRDEFELHGNIGLVQLQDRHRESSDLVPEPKRHLFYLFGARAVYAHQRLLERQPTPPKYLFCHPSSGELPLPNSTIESYTDHWSDLAGEHVTITSLQETVMAHLVTYPGEEFDLYIRHARGNKGMDFVRNFTTKVRKAKTQRHRLNLGHDDGAPARPDARICIECGNSENANNADTMYCGSCGAMLPRGPPDEIQTLLGGVNSLLTRIHKVADQTPEQRIALALALRRAKHIQDHLEDQE